MTRLEETLIHLDDFFQEQKVGYAVIGGIAVILHGLQRTTQDVDVTIAAEVEQLKPIAEKILQKFKPKKQNPVEFFQRYFVLPVIDTTTDVGIDISAGLGGFDKHVLRRSVKQSFAGRMIPCCSIEDLIIYKITANRNRDISDVEFFFKLHRDELDTKYLLKIAKSFVELERSDVLENLNKYLARK